MSRRHRNDYNDDFERRHDFGNRARSFKSRGRGRGGRGGGRPTFVQSRAFDHALSGIKQRVSNVQDLEELVERDPPKWFRLCVIYGAQVGKDWIEEKLRELGGDDFKLINYETNGKNSTAFIRTRESVVKKIRRQSYNFVDPDGKRLTQNISYTPEPTLSRINGSIEEDIKACLNNRYSFETKSLDLSAFNKDAHLNSVGLYLSLSRQNIATFVVRILAECIPELHSLNLSNNYLESLVNFKAFAEKFPKLKVLDLSNNRFRHEGILEVFKGSEIESLTVVGNPFFRTQNLDSFGTVLRRRLPNLLKLNGKDLPPRIKFGVVESKKSLPVPVLGCFPSEEMKIQALNFLKGFYEKYDSGKRDCLLDMYSDDSVLTLCVMPTAIDVRQKPVRYADSYFSMSRNLLRVREERRKTMVCHGKLQVVSALDRLPKTEHFLDSFRVDVVYHNERSILMTVSGVFREVEDNVIRLFSRTLQVDAPLAIKLDNLIISHPSIETYEKYRAPSKRTSLAEPVTSPSSLPAASPSSLPAASPSALPTAASTQDDIIKKLMQATKMNESFSRQCLNDFNFDFNGALQAFMALQRAGKIPPEAFN